MSHDNTAGASSAPSQDNQSKGGGSRRRSPNRRRRRPSGNRDGAAKSWSLEQFPVAPEAGKLRFHDLNLELPLMHGIADVGFKYASPIQAHSLPHSLCGHDVVGKAQTGTGKTAAFLVTIIDDLLKNPIPAEERFAGEPRALVIAPTRELVMQIADDAKALCKHTGLTIHTLVGGMDYSKQQKKLPQSPCRYPGGDSGSS